MNSSNCELETCGKGGDKRNKNTKRFLKSNKENIDINVESIKSNYEKIFA